MKLRTHPRRPAAPITSGFSLVELMVVIGIIAGLIALLLPAIASARARAGELKCQAALRTIGQAAMIHAHDHNGYLPLAGRHWEVPDGSTDPAALKDQRATRYVYYAEGDRQRPVPITVALALAMGVKVRLDSRDNLQADMQTETLRKHFKCPTQLAELAGVTQIDSEAAWESPVEFSSYVFNEAILGVRQKETNPDPPMGKLTKIKRTSTVMFAMDGRPRGPGRRNRLLIFDAAPDWSVWDFHRACMEPEGEQYGREALDFLRHRSRAHVLFVDGHVESVPMTEGGLSAVGVSWGVRE